MSEDAKGRFESTVATYEAARPPYGAAFFVEVARAIGLDGRQRLLDVGAGPGILAIGFAPWCRRVTGVDPKPAMIEAARAAAAHAGVALDLIEGRLEDLREAPGAFDVVTIGWAIHWLDPKPALETLDWIVAPGGKIVVCRASGVKDGRNPWLDAFAAVRRRFGGEHEPHDARAFLEGGRFRHREAITVETTSVVPVARFADRLLSFSTSSPARLSSRISEMRDVMGQAMAPFATNGLIDEIVAARADVFEG